MNLTNTTIPDQIRGILEKGLDFAVGRKPNKIKILNQFEIFFSKLMEHCDKNEINNFKKHELRSRIFLKFK